MADPEMDQEVQGCRPGALSSKFLLIWRSSVSVTVGSVKSFYRRGSLFISSTTPLNLCSFTSSNALQLGNALVAGSLWPQIKLQKIICTHHQTHYGHEVPTSRVWHLACQCGSEVPKNRNGHRICVSSHISSDDSDCLRSSVPSHNTSKTNANVKKDHLS